MRNRNNKWVLVVLLVIANILACTKKLETTDPNNPTQQSYFSNTTELQNGVNGIYSVLRSGSILSREWYTLHDMRSGEARDGGPQLEAPRAELLKQTSPAPSNAVMTSVWNGCYIMINRANLVIQKAPDVNDNTALRDRLVGEAKFLRAWAYFELVSQWGDVPVYTEPIGSPTDFKGKSPAADIYALIVSDLSAAAAILPASYTSANLGRATTGAATALLGRALIQKGDYAAAKTELLKIYGKYSLVDEYNWNFDGDVLDDTKRAIATGHEFNAESIFEAVFVDKGDGAFNWAYNGEGTTAAQSNARTQDWGATWGNVIPSDRLLAEYEPNDPRYKFTIWSVGDMITTANPFVAPRALTESDINVINLATKDGVATKRFIRKYNVYEWIYSTNHYGGLNQRLLRYADVLLMLAECEAETGTPAQAAKYINEVRARKSVNMPPVTLNTKDEAIKAVIHERWVELAEEEIINVDVLRWKKKGYYPGLLPDPRPGQVDFFPIPATETAANPLVR